LNEVGVLSSFEVLGKGASRALDNLRSFVDASTRWIEKQKNLHESYCHFEDEVWDSSLVLLATHESLPEVRDGVTRWLLEKRLNRQGAFDGDVWETCFAVLALLDATQDREALRKSIDWLCGLANDRGMIVSPSYTALAGMCVLKYMAKFDAADDTDLRERHSRFLAAISSVAPDEDYGHFPYADELWGNSIVILYLSQCQLAGLFDPNGSFYESHIELYSKHLDAVEFGREPLCRTEDLSLSSQMLYSVALATASKYQASMRLAGIEKTVSMEILASLPKVAFSFQRMFEVDLDGTTWVVRITQSTRRSIGLVIAIIGVISSMLGIWPFVEPWFKTK
jgi:hypothetical protein